MSKILAILSGFGVFFLGLFKVLAMGKNSKANEISAETVKKAKKVSDDAHRIIIDGQTKQQEIVHEDIDSTRRNILE